MLTSLRLEDWKSFGPEGAAARNEVCLGPVTLLVGPNASGKSNVLDALRFLQGAALDLPLGDVLRGRWEGQREVWPGIRGHVVEASRLGTTAFTLTSTWEIEGRLTHRIRVGTQDDVAIEAEGLFRGVSSEYLFHTHAPALRGATGRVAGGGISAAIRGTGRGNSPTATWQSQRSLLGQIAPMKRIDPAVLPATRSVRAALREAGFLDMRPGTMRDYRPENGGHLGTSGENISPVLASLSSDPARLADVVDWIGELCAPEINRIDFDRTQLREVMMFVVERDGRKVSARSLSDGTLRFLGELVALLTSPRGSLVVLEEPDVGLHPSRIRLLAELFEHVAKRRGVQILATTHSPTLLAHLSKDVLGDVVAFGRDPSTGFTVCSRLADLPHFPTLRDAGDLEHLVSTGWLERAL